MELALCIVKILKQVPPKRYFLSLFSFAIFAKLFQINFSRPVVITFNTRMNYSITPKTLIHLSNYKEKKIGSSPTSQLVSHEDKLINQVEIGYEMNA